MNLQKAALRWRKIKMKILTSLFVMFCLVLVLLMPIGWMFHQYSEGEDLQYLARRVTEIVNSHYPVFWESQKPIYNAKFGVQIDSHGGGDVARIVSIKIQQYEMNATEVNPNIARYLAMKITNLSMSNENYVHCWCVDKDFYAYPACASSIIFKPYRIETTLYNTAQRCVWGDSNEAPTSVAKEFIQVSQKIESVVKAELTSQ